MIKKNQNPKETAAWQFNDVSTLAYRKKSREHLIITGLWIALAIAAVASLAIGRFGMSLEEIFHTFEKVISGQIEANSKEAAVLFIIRIPRIFMAILVGSALAAAGASYQGLFKNPMVSPDLLGVSSGASVGACLALLLSLQGFRVQLIAFIFGLGAVFLVLAVSTAVTRASGGGLLILVLSGTVISSLCSALTSLMKYLADTNTKLPEITFWLMGSFAKTGGWRNVIILVCFYLLGKHSSHPAAVED
ncbi:MAG: iron chelate uptake ABC transporter family permease subunit [Muricomes sp.]